MLIQDRITKDKWPQEILDTLLMVAKFVGMLLWCFAKGWAFGAVITKKPKHYDPLTKAVLGVGAYRTYKKLLRSKR